MRICVTGGAGFVGTSLVRQAIQTGHVVMNYDAMTAAARMADVWEFEDDAAHTLVQGDICDANVFDQQIKAFAPDVIIHLAHSDTGNIASQLQTNILGLQNVLRIAEDYGIHTVLARPRPSFGGSTAYEMSQDAASAVVRYHAMNAKMRISRTYTNTVYGPGLNSINPISQVMRRLVQKQRVNVADNTSLISDVVFVDDYAAALLQVAEGDMEDTAFRISGPMKVSPVQMAHFIAAALAKQSRRNGGNYDSLIRTVPMQTNHNTPDPEVDRLPYLSGMTPYEIGVGKLVHWSLAENRYAATKPALRVSRVKRPAAA